MKTNSKILIVLMIIWMSCVDKVDLSLTPSALPLIIDGLVTDKAGPQIVRISRAFPVDGSFHNITAVAGATVTITDNSGATTVLEETEGGTYETSSLTGVIGRAYRLNVTTSDGVQFESTPETMLPAGTIDSIFVEFVQKKNRENQIEGEGFDVYVNATAAPGSNLRLQWRFDGTYKVTTNPALLTTFDPIAQVSIPLPCSEGCLCCTCWVPVREEAPIVINNTFLVSNDLKRVLINYIPINGKTFNERYRVEISQMEVSQEVYDFFSAVRGQFDNAASLFQPPFFELKGNVKAINNDAPVIGIFSAAAVSKKVIYLDRSNIPHNFSATEIIGDCRAVAPHSTIVQPPFWQ